MGGRIAIPQRWRCPRVLQASSNSQSSNQSQCKTAHKCLLSRLSACRRSLIVWRVDDSPGNRFYPDEMVRDGSHPRNVLGDDTQRLPFLLLEDDAVEIDDAVFHRD